ncbi:hypothetical protein F5884DRAFT_312428 [Xylogone sp. PMI_703]|nr:hypothetical protein F5884DRAFT_312428 [Xylogone sp. PMI_703]
MRWLAPTLAATISQAMLLSAAVINTSSSDVAKPGTLAESYFREDTTSNLLYTHILFMLLSWVGALPIYMMLHIAGSNLQYPLHIAFLGLHSVGMILSQAYQSKTPDLYPGNSHSKLGWVLTFLIWAQFIVGIVQSFSKRNKPDRGRDTGHELTPFLSSETQPDHRNQSSSPSELASYSSRSGHPTEESRSETLFDAHLPYNSTLEHTFDEPMSRNRHWRSVSQLYFSIRLLDIGCDFVLYLFPILGFVAICTGIVTLTGVFQDNHIFNGLAHFIKGGVFFWLGIFTLSRWSGCFSTQGWAWNLPPGPKHYSISMEAIECSLLLIYGVTNVFLEHLSAWGETWSPMDIEHVAISLLFIGGGLCGLMVESKILRTIIVPDTGDMRLHDDSFSKSVDVQSHVPINPIPAMTIFLLGFTLSGHHQSNMESTVMHNQVGNLLAGASAARCITYLFLHISPSMSVYPSRPPSELICSFSLMCGGIMLMASNKDTIQAMTDNHVPAISVAIVTMSVTAVLMAWIMFAISVKTRAVVREERRKSKPSQA